MLYSRHISTEIHCTTVNTLYYSIKRCGRMTYLSMVGAVVFGDSTLSIHQEAVSATLL